MQAGSFPPDSSASISTKYQPRRSICGFLFCYLHEDTTQKTSGAKENVTTTLYAKYQSALIETRCFDPFRNIWEYVNALRHQQKTSLVTPVVVQPM